MFQATTTDAATRPKNNPAMDSGSSTNSSSITDASTAMATTMPTTSGTAKPQSKLLSRSRVSLHRPRTRVPNTPAPARTVSISRP